MLQEPGPDRPSVAALPASLWPAFAWLAVAAFGVIAGHSRALDAGHVLEIIGDAHARVQAKGLLAAVTAVAAALSAVFAAHAGAALLGDRLGSIWLGVHWPDRLASRLTARRRRAWTALNAEAAEARRVGNEDGYARYSLERNRISLAPPCRPTQAGDRIAAVETRVGQQYGLDLFSAWPRLWLLLPDSAQAEYRAASAAWRRATATGAWGFLYAVVGLWWWPALVIAAGTALAALLLGRGAIASVATTAESIVDVFLPDLYIRLNLDHTDPGRAATARFRKGT